jgi:hypothetical protein
MFSPLPGINYLERKFILVGLFFAPFFIQKYADQKSSQKTKSCPLVLSNTDSIKITFERYRR